MRETEPVLRARFCFFVQNKLRILDIDAASSYNIIDYILGYCVPQ